MTVQREGFWATSKSESGAPIPLPYPQHSDVAWKGKKKFLALLEHVEQYGGKFGTVRADMFRGFSMCRCCRKPNGSGEYTATFDFSKNDRPTVWVWPSGYAHYIREHNVRPSLAFQEFIVRVASLSGGL
jgi:hypothetical protein